MLFTEYPDPPLRLSETPWMPRKSRRSTKKRKKNQSGVLGKICFTCHCLPARQRDAEISSSDDGYVPANPTLCFDACRLCVDGYCVCGSTLFLIGSKQNAVYSYDLPSSWPLVPSLSPPIQLTEDMLCLAPPMNFPKHYPEGCQTPDGKRMLVFSTTLDADTKHNKDNGNFELFDPTEGTWTPLSDIRPLLRRRMEERSRGYFPDYMKSVPVWSYSFINNAPVFLITTELGNFTLDIRKPDNVWQKLEEFQGPGPLKDHGTPMLVRGRLCLMEWLAWVRGTDRHQWLLSHPEFLSGFWKSPGTKITWLLSNRCFCVLSSHVKKATMQPHLTVDVCEFDSQVDLAEIEEVPALNVKKSFKFVLGRQYRDSPFSFAPLSHFNIT